MTPASPQPSAFDWDHGSWAKDQAPGIRAEVIVSGDWAPIRAFGPVIAADPGAVYGDLLPVLRAGDLRITNLECPLAAGGSPVWKSGSVFKGGPEHLGGLTAVPFEVATLANNHVLDFGPEALGETLGLLDRNGIRTVGAGLGPERAHSPLVLDLKGIRLGIVNFSEGEDLTAAVDGPGVSGWDLDRVTGSVEALRRSVDALLVICHCGVEYTPFPPPYVVEALQRTVDAGADLVVAHHPHVAQGVQIYRNVPICYSLGNFVFHQETTLAHRKVGFLVKARFARSGLAGIELVPYRIGGRSLGLLDPGARAGFFASMRAISAPLAEAGTVADAWHALLRHQGRAGFRREVGMILEQMDREPEKGAAMFRNRLSTPQHREQWLALLTRIMDGSIDSAPAWACDLVAEWFTATAPPA